MKAYLYLLILFFVHACGCTGAFAQTGNPNTQSIFEFLDAKTNFVKNPYARVNTNNVTCTGVTPGRATGSGELNGTSAHLITTTTAGQKCAAQFTTPFAPYNAPNERCIAIVRNNGATSSDYDFYVGGVLVAPLTNVAGATYEQAYLDLPCAATAPTMEVIRRTTGASSAMKYGFYYGPSNKVTTSARKDIWKSTTLSIGGTTTAPAKGGVKQADLLWYKWNGPNMDFRIEYHQTSAGTAGSGDYLFSTLPAITGCTIDTTKVTVNTGAVGNTVNSVGSGQGNNGTDNGTAVAVVFDSSNVRLATTASSAPGTYSYVSSGWMALSNSSVGYSASFSVPCLNPPSLSDAVATLDQMDFTGRTFSPNITYNTGNPGTVTWTGTIDRIGSKAKFKLVGLFSNTSSAFQEVVFNLPSGYTIDASKYPTNLAIGYNLGTVNVNDSGIATYSAGNAVYISPTQIYLRAPAINTHTGTVGVFAPAITNTFPIPFGTADTINAEIEVDVVEFRNPAPPGVIKIDPPADIPFDFTSSGTLTIPSTATELFIDLMTGPGGGGGGSGTTAGTGGTGGNGSGNTTFGSLLTVGPGIGGGAGGSAALGGSATIMAPWTGLAIKGNPGGPGGGQATFGYVGGGAGGVSCYGAGSGGGMINGVGLANNAGVDGSGGGGAGSGPTAANVGGGGGSGGCIRNARISNPTATLGTSVTVTIGTGGAAGAAGTSGFAGAAGGNGRVTGRIRFSSWDAMLASGALARVPGANVTPGLSNSVENFSFYFSSSGSACTSSPCTLSQIGSAVTSVPRNSTGNYTINTAKTYAKLFCTANLALLVGGQAPVISPMQASNTSSLTFGIQRADTGGVIDNLGVIMCQGQLP